MENIIKKNATQNTPGGFKGPGPQAYVGAPVVVDKRIEGSEIAYQSRSK